MLILTQFKIGCSPAAVSQGILRVEADGFVEVLDSLLRLVQYKIGCSPVAVSQVILRIEADGFVEVLNSLLSLVQSKIGCSPTEVCLGKLWIEADGLVPFNYGLFRMSLLLKFHAAILAFLGIRQASATR